MSDRLIPSLETITAVGCCLVASGYFFFFSGCSQIDAAVDLETARNEAVYVPAEVAATLALGVARAQDYGSYSSVVHQSYSVGQPITTDGCIGIQLVEAVGADGFGALSYDFAGCSGQSGRVAVEQVVTYEPLPEDEARDEIPGEENWTDTDGDGVPDEGPEGAGGLDGFEGEDLRDLLTGSADVSVSYENYSEGLLEVSGTLALTGGVEVAEGASGDLDADLSVSALDYGGAIDATGSWSTAPGSDSDRLLSFAGDFVSSTGLTWTVIASNVQLSPGCYDAMGGELTATFTNDHGTTEVTAKFDEVCDGCAQMFVDGADIGPVCFPTDKLTGDSEEGPAI